MVRYDCLRRKDRGVPKNHTLLAKTAAPLRKRLRRVLCVLMGEIICPICRYLKYTDFDTVVFTLGYPRKDDISRRMEFKVSDISIDCGKPEWGAEPDKKYFVIKLGERIKYETQD